MQREGKAFKGGANPEAAEAILRGDRPPAPVAALRSIENMTPVGSGLLFLRHSRAQLGQLEELKRWVGL